MNERTTDAEKLAALLDGRLSEAEREAVLARLASDDAAFEAYAEAVAVTGELHPEGTGDIHRLRPRRAWWRNPRAGMLAAAAGLAAVLAVPWALEQRRGELDPATFVALIGSPAAERPPSAWPARRSADAVADRGLTLRLGAEIAWLELAIGMGDVERIRSSAAEIDSLLDGVPAAAPIAAIYRSVAAEPARPASELEPLVTRAGESVERLVDSEMLTLGAWLEMARLAVEQRQASYFTAPDTLRLLDSVAEHQALTPAGREALDRIRSAAAGSAGPDWEALRRELQELPRALVSG